jgi:ribonucleoside-diphosphate reductase alpha chain
VPVDGGPGCGRRCASRTGTGRAEEDGAACYLRPGDDGFEECEACQ